MSWDKWEEKAQDIKGLRTNLETGKVEMQAVLFKGADPLARAIPGCRWGWGGGTDRCSPTAQQPGR